ncbi:hypothetical protein PHMEG_00030638 [Phytophthora megakarya]|uniref:CBM1 domain-containing protein n=1 Tax=Phytophthora megakarya TaxID=4795 RepID=A0A225V1J2_9STRA|nr:hypothetical protein PHMEG_00030638 [Phytophthora megakarya]
MLLATFAAAQERSTESLDTRDDGISSSNSDRADAFYASTTGSAIDGVTDVQDTIAPSSTSPVAQPIVGGVKMFGQCGGIFYTGTTDCYDPDAYCKELSMYSSICTPKPIHVILSFAAFMILSLDVVAQGGDQRSTSGSGDNYDAGHTTAPASAGQGSRSSTKATAGNSDTNPFGDGNGVVPQWGRCDDNAKCAKGSYCKLISDDMSICYPA